MLVRTMHMTPFSLRSKQDSRKFPQTPQDESVWRKRSSTWTLRVPQLHKRSISHAAASSDLDGMSIFHSIAANGNIGLSGQAHWLPVAVIIRNCAPKSPTVPGGHATTRVKQTSASKGPARRDSYPWCSQKGRKRHKCYGAEYCPYLSSG